VTRHESTSKLLGVLALGCVLTGCGATPVYAEATPHAEERGADGSHELSESRRQQLLIGYDLLAKALDDEARLDTLKVVKKVTLDGPNDAIAKLMERLSDASEKRIEELERLRALRPRVSDSPEPNPVGEAIREVATDYGKAEMMSRDGGFDVRFVLVQAQATRMVAAIATALARFDPEPRRKQWLKQVARDYEGYRSELIEYLGGKPAT